MMFLQDGFTKTKAFTKDIVPPKARKFMGTAFRAYLYFLAVVFVLILIRLKTYTGDSVWTMIPNFLLYTPFIVTNARWWTRIVSYEGLPTYEMQPLPEMLPKEDGTLDFEELRRITNNFRDSAVVRGLFVNTTAMKKWTQQGYLEEKLKNFTIPVFLDGDESLAQKEVVESNLGTAFDKLVGSKKSTLQLFFPKHRPGYDASPELFKAVNDVTRIDLDLERILWHGFGTAAHKNYLNAQIIAANGFVDEIGKGSTTGTFWHCAPGNNYFIQAVGKKRWKFIPQIYSSYMQAGRIGKAGMSAPMKLDALEKHLPVRYVDMNPGDMIYNPDWVWHRIENYKGLSIGVPLREVNMTLAFSNNFQFSSITVWNMFLKYGLGYEQTFWDARTPTHD